MFFYKQRRVALCALTNWQRSIVCYDNFMRWPHFEHVIFDCDSTLSTIEGIDFLAELAGRKDEVEQLTKLAMDGELDLEEVYARRLSAIVPNAAQIRAVRDAYKRTIVTDADTLIAALKSLGHNIYIISGGLYEPVAEFGVFLGVARENIRAVEIEYDQLSGKWWEGDDSTLDYLAFDEGPLTVSDGKARIVRELIGDKQGRSLLIGDGNSDFHASAAVDLFVGFGGVESRQQVRDNAPAFIHSESIAPLLALAAGPALMKNLSTKSHINLLQKTHDLITQGAITFNDARLGQKFQAAYQAVYL